MLHPFFLWLSECLKRSRKIKSFFQFLFTDLYSNCNCCHACILERDRSSLGLSDLVCVRLSVFSVLVRACSCPTAIFWDLYWNLWSNAINEEVCACMHCYVAKIACKPKYYIIVVLYQFLRLCTYVFDTTTVEFAQLELNYKASNRVECNKQYLFPIPKLNLTQRVSYHDSFYYTGYSP